MQSPEAITHNIQKMRSSCIDHKHDTCMQATLPKRSGVEGGTFKPYMKGVYFAYAFVCYCYFTLAITGYWAFGEDVLDNVLLSIKRPTWLVAVADMFVVVHTFGSYQVCHTAAYVAVGSCPAVLSYSAGTLLVSAVSWGCVCNYELWCTMCSDVAYVHGCHLHGGVCD